MNKKLLEQLALADEAGTKAMAKDFFAPTPGGEDESTEAGTEAPPDEGGGSVAMQAEGELSPEQLEELMRMLESQGGGAP